MKDRIVIRNARQHNLKGVDLELPRRALVVVTGPSGSGKSSLAFDTIYAEGQRRYVESLSTYAKQFLERMEKPAVDFIDGISPAVAIEQKNPTKSSRSTVGTATEVHDYLRLLWARAGRTHCPECGRRVQPDTVQSATDDVMALPDGTRFMVTFPMPLSARAKHATVVENLRALGFVRVLADGDTLDLDGEGAADPETFGHDLAAVPDLLVVVDRLVVRGDIGERLADSIATAFAEGDGEAEVVFDRRSTIDDRTAALRFTERFRCPDHPDAQFAEPTPRLFSFNNPYGTCPECTGFGAVLEYDESLIIPNPGRSLSDGAVDPWEMPRYKRQREGLLEFAREWGVSVNAPWKDLAERFRRDVLKGARAKGARSRFQGVLPFLRSKEKKRYKQYIRVFLRRYQLAKTCPACGGARLRPEALRVHIAGEHIGQVTARTITDARAWVARIREDGAAAALSPQERDIAAPILRELAARLEFLDDVGLGYLTLDRLTRSLSGGEAQRIALANSLGASLVDTLYVLDEPTIGLHPRDNDRLIALLKRLRSAGNSVLVVEHDPAVIASADHVVELGPASGEKGGELVFQGTYDELRQANTTTGHYLAGDRHDAGAGDGHAGDGGGGRGRGQGGAPRSRRRDVDGAQLVVRGARLHNLDGVDVSIPLHTLTVVTGVSGSGKSTLVHDVVYRALERELAGEISAKRYLGEPVGAVAALEGAGQLDAVALVDQSPIGRTPRSNPVTYIKAFHFIRDLFARQPLARERGYKPGHFSFNVKGGRCETCKGDGMVQVEMVFMADVYVPCDVCGGARYRKEVLDVKYKGKSIRDVLDMTVDEAIRFFIREDRLGQALWHLQQVGLGYLRLGQAAPTLSGGEAQRLKIARELAGAGRKKGRRLYILDEPTTGLSGPEVRKLLDVLQKLVDAGHTVLVIEHNLELIRAADWIIDLGPEAGPGGGEVVGAGRPADIAKIERSWTGVWLRRGVE
ncbi:MAG TPA: hypothetical protein VJ957_05855 [Longimicrobiales bacterium]|nr:hypothetical protein [Longimicrobiales bacterium]